MYSQINLDLHGRCFIIIIIISDHFNNSDYIYFTMDSWLHCFLGMDEVTLLSLKMWSKKWLFWLVFLEKKTVRQIFKEQSTGIGFLGDEKDMVSTLWEFNRIDSSSNIIQFPDIRWSPIPTTLLVLSANQKSRKSIYEAICVLLNEFVTSNSCMSYFCWMKTRAGQIPKDKMNCTVLPKQ